MPQQIYTIHDYVDYDKVEHCIGSPMLNAEYVRGCIAMAGSDGCIFDISSVGGDLKAGIDMYDAIRAAGNVDTRIGAMAASSAGIVAMGGKVVKMSRYGLLMLHKPMVGSAGNADDLQADINLLNIMQGRIAQIYADKSGLDIETVNSLINSVTWLTADQALTLGFIDEIVDYEAEVVNHGLMAVYVKANATLLNQRVFNKLTTITNTMTEAEKAAKAKLEQDNAGILKKIMNFFKKQEVKTVTDKGTINSLSPLNVGVSVSNEEGEDMPDDTYTFKNSEGKEVKMKVKDGVVDEFETEADEEDTDEDVQNATILNGFSLKVTNKGEAAGIAKVIAQLQKDKTEAINNLATVTNQLQVSNEAIKKKDEVLRAELKSEFEAKGSKRSDTTKVPGVTNEVKELIPTSTAAKKAYDKAVADLNNK